LSKLINGVEELEKFMSNLLKSKFLLGVVAVAIMFVGVVAVSNTASAACSITTTLRVGSKGAEVQCLQTNLGITADGSFGPKTKAAVMAFQSAHSLVADGVFGPMSRAAWMNAGPGSSTLPAGCTSTSGFSSTTGYPCSGSSYPAGCMSNSGFSSTTGFPCSGGSVTLPAGCATGAGFSSTTGVPCTTTTTNTGTNGYLADLSADSTNRVSTVYESEQDKVVAGFRATARLADQTVDRVRVTFLNGGTGSGNLSKYISGASLWLGGTKLATMSVADADRATANDTYTFNFSGLAGKIPRDQIGRFYVSVNANGSLDTADTGAGSNFTVKFLAAGVSASSPDGTYDTYPGADLTTTGLSFGKFSSNGVKATVGLSSSNPVAGVVTVNNTAATNNVTLLKFTIKATNSDLTLRRIPIQVNSTVDGITTMINTIKLYNGTNLVDSLDGSAIFDVSGAGTTINSADSSLASVLAGGYLFTNLSDPYNKITAGSTAEFSVVVDLKQVNTNYTEGDTLLAKFANADALLTANFSVLDSNGDQLLAGGTYRIGSAVGEIQTLRVNGIQISRGTASVVTTLRGGTAVGASDIVNVVYSIPVTMTAFGQTLYIPKTAAYNSDTANGVALAYGFIDASDPATVIASGNPATDVSAAATGPTLSSTDASTEGSAWRLDAGVAKHFILTVTLNSSASEAQIGQKNFAVVLSELQTYLTSTVSGAGTEQTLIPIQDYQTGYQAINYGS
jgi:peptidoglycan hydrolase-like protein with peptidoglycan-binding domain